jgi:hypothetical protein
LSAAASGRRIGWGDELGNNRRRPAKGGIIQHRQVLVDGPARRLRRQAGSARDAALAVGVGGNQAGVRREAFAADQTFGHAAIHDGLEQLTQQIALTEAAMTVLREG